jgi:hypothetical protein
MNFLTMRVWNAWRTKKPDEDIDLRLANLSGADYLGADLSGVLYTRTTKWPQGFDPPESAILNDVSSRDYADVPGAPAGQEDFTITFSEELSAEQIRTALEALADYYRAVGGVGFRTDFDLVSIAVGAPEHVTR